MNCLICGRKGYPICRICQENPFFIEKVRQILASKKEYSDLEALYAKRFKEINNLNTKRFWDYKIQRNKNNSLDGMTKDRIHQVFKFIPLITKNIIDIGAGYGYIERLISKRKDIKIYGNDISENAVKDLSKKYVGNFKRESIYNMEYPDNYFDVVLMLEVLEHIPPSKIFSVLKKVNKMLKKRGIFILSVPVNEGLDEMKDNPNSHLRMYTKELISFELNRSGFEVNQSKEFFAFEKLYFIKKYLSKFMKTKWKPNDLVIKATKL